MQVLYGYSVKEVLAERKSFAFRPSRSTQDAHAYMIETICKRNTLAQNSQNRQQLVEPVLQLHP